MHHTTFHAPDPNDMMTKPHFNHNGELTGFSHHNIFGGKDYFDSHNNFTGYTADNIVGGHDYNNSHGVFLGHTDNLGFHDPFTHPDGHAGSTPQMIKFHDPHTIHNHFSGIRENLLGKLY